MGLFSKLQEARKLGLTSAQHRAYEDLFDAKYYQATQPDVTRADIAPERHFAASGWREGRGPNATFDTIWYLHANPDAARAGLNPLIHYVREGAAAHLSVQPDQKGDPDWREAAQANDALPDPMRQFLAAYNKVKRSGLFDANFYRAKYQINQGDPLEFFVRHGSRAGHSPNPYFDTAWYVSNYSDVRTSGVDPFQHYLDFGIAEGRRGGPAQWDEDSFDADDGVSADDPQAQADAAPAPQPAPPPESPAAIEAAELAKMAADFDEAFYRDANRDIDFSTIRPIEHFARYGWRENRDPSPHFSIKGYFHHNPDVREAGMNPFLHYVLNGAGERRVSRGVQRAPRPADGSTEWRSYEEVRQFGYASLESREPDPSALDYCAVLRGLDVSEIAARIALPQPKTDDIVVSVVIPCMNEELVTVECLVALEKAMPETFGVEVIVADNASSDPAFAVIAANPTIRTVRFEKNIGFGPACNAGAAQARGKYLFFLNNDAQIAPGCLEALVAAAGDPGIGLVGPKLLCFDGSLQEAGCLLNADGTGALIGFGQDPRNARYNYARPVEHVSGAAILIARDLFGELGGFDDVFAPAYCEDADLSLKVRAKGLTVYYEPAAVVAHHLSKTTNANTTAAQSKRQRISRNRQVLVQRWADQLAAHKLRTIAFYLPQYHPIPENDLWWGKGFTEWTNVAKTQPNYVGQNQPRLPADLGYYDLRVAEVMEQQAELARRYGVTGFCYYYYWFDGKRLLEHPLERMLETGKPNLPFCLCWANENWTRRWDGRDSDVLLGQSYTDEGMLEIVADFARYFRNDAYIRVDGKPLMLVYRIKELPNPARAMTVWRNYCRQNGIGEICIAMVESFELSARPEDPKKYGCDITVEFPAHGMVNDPPRPVEKINFDWTGAAHDYRQLAAAFMRRPEVGFRRIRSVLVGWDNTPRHRDRSLILENATPGAFQAWLEWTYRRTLEQNYGDERLVFVLAWNEWGEGSYLEPDRQFGHGYLQAVRNALETVESGGHAFVVPT
jgi:GT2 family glycosyltransferase